MHLIAMIEPHARRMVAISLFGAIVGPLLWVIPPLPNGPGGRLCFLFVGGVVGVAGVVLHKVAERKRAQALPDESAAPRVTSAS